MKTKIKDDIAEVRASVESYIKKLLVVNRATLKVLSETFEALEESHKKVVIEDVLSSFSLIEEFLTDEFWDKLSEEEIIAFATKVKDLESDADILKEILSINVSKET